MEKEFLCIWGSGFYLTEPDPQLVHITKGVLDIRVCQLDELTEKQGYNETHIEDINFIDVGEKVDISDSGVHVIFRIQ